MAITPDTFYAKQYGDMVSLLAQQKGSKLRNTVQVKTGVKAEECYMDQVDFLTAQPITGRFQSTQITDTPHYRRRIALAGYYVNPALDPNDHVKMIVDPTSAYAKSGMYAMGRQIDDLIIAAATGTAFTGKAGGTSTTLPSTQKVAAASAGMTLAKWLAAKEILDGNDVDESEERFLIVTAEQLIELLNTTEIKSADYNSVKALVQGQIDTYLGFKVIRTQRLTTDTNSDRQVLAFTKSGIGLAVSEDIITRIDERTDLNYTKQIYCRMHMGSSRLEEKKVVEIACVVS